MTNLEVTINDSESDSKLITTKTNNHSNSTTTTTTIDSKTNKGQTNGKTKKVVQKSIRKTGNKKSLKQCDICGTFVKEMSTHKYTHIASNQELYMECDYCGKKYFGRKNLRQHFETHFRTKFVIFTSLTRFQNLIFFFVFFVLENLNAVYVIKNINRDMNYHST